MYIEIVPVIADPIPLSVRIYTIRLLVFISVFLLPILALFIQVIIFIIWRDRKYLSNRISNEIHKYNVILHNFGFIFVLILFNLIFVIMIYFGIITSTSAWWNNNKHLWQFNKIFTKNMFLTWVYFGLTFYLIDCFIYFAYNLLRTNSYFALKFRNWQSIEKKKKIA